MKYSKVLKSRISCRACGGKHINSTRLVDDRGNVVTRNVCLNRRCGKKY